MLIIFDVIIIKYQVRTSLQITFRSKKNQIYLISIYLIKLIIQLNLATIYCRAKLFNIITNKIAFN